MKTKPIVVSLFCGAGGFDLGFLDAGYNIIYACDNNSDCIDTYRTNIGNHAYVKDISTLSSADIPSCDIVIGGPPCQGFSVAGKMDPNDCRSNLVWHFARLVSDIKPKFFIMENVKALGTLSRWESVRLSLKEYFLKAGYQVSMTIMNARDYGVPQSRERVFFMGTRMGSKISFSPTKSEITNVRKVLLSLPKPGIDPNLGICNAKITPAKNPILRKSPYAGMLFNGQGRPINLDSVSNTLPASMGGNRTPIIDEDELRHGCTSWIFEYHTKLMSGMRPLTKVPKRLRRITVTEASLLQSFPRSYLFKGKQSSQYQQIGNAVPPLLSRAIAREFVNVIG